jgi:hypothetical protein
MICSDLAFLPRLSFLACLSKLSCSGCPIMNVLYRSTCPICPGPQLFQTPVVLSRLSVLVVLYLPLDQSLLFCPDCPLQATVSCFQLCILSQLFCLSRVVPIILSLLSYSDPLFLSWLSSPERPVVAVFGRLFLAVQQNFLYVRITN